MRTLAMPIEPSPPSKSATTYKSVLSYRRFWSQFKLEDAGYNQDHPTAPEKWDVDIRMNLSDLLKMVPANVSPSTVYLNLHRSDEFDELEVSLVNNEKVASDKYEAELAAWKISHKQWEIDHKAWQGIVDDNKLACMERNIERFRKRNHLNKVETEIIKNHVAHSQQHGEGSTLYRVAVSYSIRINTTMEEAVLAVEDYIETR